MIELQLSSIRIFLVKVIILKIGQEKCLIYQRFCIENQSLDLQNQRFKQIKNVRRFF